MRIKKTKILSDSSDEDVSNGDSGEKSHCSKKIESISEDNASMSKRICNQRNKKYVNKDDFGDNDSVKTGRYPRTKKKCVYKESSGSDENPRKKKRVRLKSDSDDEYVGIGCNNKKTHGKCKKNKNGEHKDSTEDEDSFNETQGTSMNTPVRQSSRIYQKDSAKGSKSLPDRRSVLDKISPQSFSTELKNTPSYRKRMEFTNNLIISRNSYNTELSYEMEDSLSEDDFIISDNEADSSEESEEEEHQERKKRKACKRLKKRKSCKQEKKSKKIDSDSDENYSDASNIDKNYDKLDKDKKIHDSSDDQFDSISPIPTKDVYHENEYKKVFPKRTKTKGYQKSLEKLQYSRKGKKMPLDKTEMEETQDGLSSSDNIDLFNETNDDSDEDFIDDEGEDDWNIALKDIIDEWKNPEPFKKAATPVKKHKRLKFHSSSSEESNDEGQNMSDTVKKFMHHVTANDIEAVKSLLVVHDLVNEIGNNKQTALHIAAMQGLTPMVELLLKKSADINLVDKKNLTPLGHAALNKYPICFELLLKKSNIAIFSRNLYKDLNGINILHLLLMESPTERKSLKEDALKCFKIVYSFNKKMFIRFLSQTDNRTPTPLMTAIMEDQVEVIKFIINCISGQSKGNESNDCLEFRTDEGGNILHFAVQHSAGCLAEIIPYVINDINEQDIHSFTPLMYAAELGKDDCLEVLLNFNASVDVEDKDGVTALHLAAVSGNLKSIKLLLKFGHQVDVVDRYGWPPLLYANFRANEECVIALFAKNPQQIFCLGELMSDKDPDQVDKNAKVIQQTLQSISHIDAYYSVFNDFIASGDNISLLDKNDHGCFAKTWRVILSFKNKVRWLMKKHQSGFASQLNIDRQYILESAIDQIHHSFTLRGMDVRFQNEPGSCLGPKKEFCELLTKDLLIPGRKLFIKAADEEHYIPSSNAYFLERMKENESNLKIDSRDKEYNKSATNNKVIEPHELMEYQSCLDNSDEYIALFDMADELSNSIANKCGDRDKNVEINYGAGNLDTTIKQQKKPSKALKKIAKYQKKLAVTLERIEFAGQFTAQVLLCEQIHISLQLSKPFIKQVLGIELNHREELSEYDHQLFSSIKNNNVDELELPFSLMAVNSWNGKLEEILLGEKGNELITEGNKHDYLAFVSEFKLCTSISREMRMFRKGFYKVIQKDVISIFNADEFALLLNGVAKIDICDWKRNTIYVHCSKSSSVITWFWSVVDDLIEEEKSLLLKFATGSPCVPAEGFSQLQGLSGINLFTIIVSKTDKDKLPEAATCFNTLTLPDYANEKVLREKLLIAIRHGCEGFAFE